MLGQIGVNLYPSLPFFLPVRPMGLWFPASSELFISAHRYQIGSPQVASRGQGSGFVQNL